MMLHDEETIGSPDALAVPLGDGRGWTRPCQSPGWQGVSRENRIPDETGTMVFTRSAAQCLMLLDRDAF
jgi:hypothetical protein